MKKTNEIGRFSVRLRAPIENVVAPQTADSAHVLGHVFPVGRAREFTSVGSWREHERFGLGRIGRPHVGSFRAIKKSHRSIRLKQIRPYP